MYKERRRPVGGGDKNVYRRRGAGGMEGEG